MSRRGGWLARGRPPPPRAAAPARAAAPRPPPQPAEPPCDAGRERPGQARPERRLVEVRAAVGRAPLEPAARPHPLQGIVLRVRAIQERGRPSVEAHEGDQVPAVVAEDPRKRSPVSGPEVAEVDLWHEGAGQIVPAIEPEE